MAGPVQRGHAMSALVLGIIEVVCGLLIIILSVVVAGKSDFGAAASPYWAGIVFAIPGILGIVTGITKNHCSMIAFMVLNIIAFIIQGIGCILLAIFVAVFAVYTSQINERCTQYGNVCTCEYNGNRQNFRIDSCDALKTATGMMIAIVVFLVIAAIITLAASIVGCASVCCSNNTQGGVVIQQQGGKY